jgi:hypothetical protein
MESADAVRQYINTANDDILKEIQSTERLQSSVYNDFIELLTNEHFFIPLLQSKSKELVGRFCLKSLIAIRALYRTYGTSEFLDTPGHFEVEFTSAGIPQVSMAFDQYFSKSLTTNLSPYVQNNIRFRLSTSGWKCWWADGKFCFQPAADSKLIQESILLANLYTPMDMTRKDPVQRSPLCLDSTLGSIW